LIRRAPRACFSDIALFSVFGFPLPVSPSNPPPEVPRAAISSKIKRVSDAPSIPPAGPEAHGEPTRCSHCGRPVAETVHTRTSYRVDYYELNTGPVEPATLRHGEDGPVQTYQRLLAHQRVVTCSSCYRDPAVLEERERRFRPEAYEVGEEEVPG